jgi:GT2 family glycosyltransferase
MARVSLLIPTYSRPDDLGRCIDAVLASTVGDFEILVGDNGRQGGAVCAERHDPRLRYIAHPSNLGMAGNWNTLLDAAVGEYVALCSDDDRIHPTFLERCVDAFEADPSLGVVFTNHLFDRGGRVSIRPTSVRPGRHADFAHDLLRHKPVAASAALVRRAAWDVVRPLPDTAAADMVLFGRLAEAGFAFCYIDEPLMTYAVHEGMLSSSDAFRSDRVTAWDVLRFSSRDAELERRRLLVEALVSRARLHLQRRHRTGAREDLRRARRVGGARCLPATLLTTIAAELPSWALQPLTRRS